MKPPIVWIDAILGILSIVFALIGPQLQRRRSHETSRFTWSIWGRVAFITLGLCTWIAVAASLSSGKATQVWYALTYAGGFVVLFSVILALIQSSKARR